MRNAATDGLAVVDLRCALVDFHAKLFFRRSTIISRCSSPMPLMMVCPVSMSLRAVNVGSSSASLDKAMPSLSRSFCVLGSTASPITGSRRYGFQHNGMFVGTNGVSRTQIAEADTAADISGLQHLNGVLLVGVHLIQAVDPFAFSGTHVQYCFTRFHNTGICPYIR